MDIQYNQDGIFEVEICQKIDGISNKEKCSFFQNELDIYNCNEYLTIEENRNTYMIFKCKDSSARLYMDGLETISKNIVLEDEEGVGYVSPSNDKIILYDKDQFPLIPGFFRIVIKLQEKLYFSMIKVKPKLIQEYELDIIKKDLEDEINGLAFELIRKNIGVGKNNIYNLPIRLYKFYIIKNKFYNIISALEDLKIKPNYKILRKYKIVKEDEIKFIDGITIKSYLESNIDRGFLKEPVTVVDYDLPENQWVKKIIKYIINYLNEFIEESNNFIDINNKDIEEMKEYNRQDKNIKLKSESIEYLHSLIELACKMKNAINMLSTVNWFKSISNKVIIDMPHTLFSDFRYNCIYKLYKDLKSNDFNITLDNKYAIQWKRTDKLYEMWCFIKIGKIIAGEKLNYEIIGGWIFDNIINTNKILIPQLKSGTKIRFKKGNIYLNLIYDEKIPYCNKDTSLKDMPIYITRSNNRPDGRIDIYNKDIYIGSIILEFKYRNGNSLWHEDYIKYQNENGSNVIKQLTAYGNCCSSYYLFKKTDNHDSYTDVNYGEKSDVSPVKKVLIIYPKGKVFNNKQIDNQVFEVKDHNLKFIKVSPRNLTDKLEETISLAIEELLGRSEMYI